MPDPNTPGPARTAPVLRRSLPRSLLSHRGVFRLSAFLTAFALLVTLFYVVENWRGQRAWERCLQDLTELGEPTDYASILPPPIPDASNVMAHPFVKARFIRSNATSPAAAKSAGTGLPDPPAWPEGIGPSDLEMGKLTQLPREPAIASSGSSPDNTATNQPSLLGLDLLFAQSDPAFAALTEAFERPQMLLRGNPDQPAESPIVDFVATRNSSMILAARVRLELLLGDQETALCHLRLLRRLMDLPLANHPPTLVGSMIHVAIAGLYVDVVADGLREGLWSPESLPILEADLRSLRLFETYLDSIRSGERLAVLQILANAAQERSAREHLFDVLGDKGSLSRWRSRMLAFLIPRGWIYQNMVVVARAAQLLLQGIDAERHRVDPASTDANGEKVSDLVARRPSSYTYLARRVVPNLSRATQTVARRQASIDQALVACALERYRAQTGMFPDPLERLVPTFLESLPPDVITGDPPRYERLAEGSYHLYHAGWNATDDGGVATNDLDWVWNGPPHGQTARPR